MIRLDTEIRDASHRQVKKFWHNFVRETVNHVGMGTEGILRRRLLEEHGAHLIATHWGYVIDFDRESDITHFLLRWGGE